jgi:hypothetical protein
MVTQQRSVQYVTEEIESSLAPNKKIENKDELTNIYLWH